MSRYKVLNSKEKKKVLAMIQSQWDVSVSLDYVFLQSKDKIYVVNQEFASVILDKLHFNSIGMYFGKIINDSFRLSIEGSQIIGPYAKKNIFELSDEQSKLWIAGNDLEVDNSSNTFVIIKHDSDFLGCGKISNKKLYNYVPKSRRL